MRYASIRDIDISNGEGVGVALFVQGCHFHCVDCFNQETWDFDGGKLWDEVVEKNFIELLNRPYITRVSILGGEPLAKENVKTTLGLVLNIREKFGNSKNIWLYTGYNWNDVIVKETELIDDNNMNRFERYSVVKECDVVIDGRFEKSKKDLKYAWAGSTNQRVIDVKNTIKNNHEVVLWG